MPDTAIRFAGVAIVAAVVACIARPTAAQDVPLPANVVIIVSDDAGYADFSMHGSDVMRTPRLDALAAAGVRFTQGYVSASVCSPSRAGLLTGRHQQRFGHEFNIPPRYSEENGLPVDESGFANGIGNDDEYEGAVELQNLLGESEVVRDCVAKQWFTYANGRPMEPADTCQLEAIQAEFEENGGDLVELLVSIVTRPEFRLRSKGES